MVLLVTDDVPDDRMRELIAASFHLVNSLRVAGYRPAEAGAILVGALGLLPHKLATDEQAWEAFVQSEPLRNAFLNAAALR